MTKQPVTTTPLNILIVEDAALDAELLVHELESAGYALTWKRVETEPDYRASLGPHLNLIFSDFGLPKFSTPRALALLQESKLDVPFIIVSGTIGEERAVESLKSGATDYVLKTHLARLVPVVDRALREAHERSHRKQLEEQLRQSQKMEAIGQLAGGVAHDFNNLLAIIRGNAELVMMDAGQLGGEAGEQLKQVIAASERAAGLTRQLLAFGRKQIMQPQPLNLNDVIGNLTKMLNRIIGEDVRLQCNYVARLAFVQADPGMMEQVLVNLVVNARDAMPKGGQLLIATDKISFDESNPPPHPEARAGEFVVLSVTDTGTGIAPEHLVRIFEPFFTTKEVGKGTGLGLATVYGIVKQHQGWIEVSTRPGAGTTFKVFLPAIQPAAITSPAEARPDLRGGTERILLVEDDVAVRLLTRRILESAGYRVWEAVSGKEALEAWRDRTAEIDLLFTDVVMPDGVTGRELAEHLRTKRPSLKVVFTSGYSADVAGKDTEFIRRDKRYFLQKPCPSAVLIQTVRQCLDEK